ADGDPTKVAMLETQRAGKAKVAVAAETPPVQQNAPATIQAPAKEERAQQAGLQEAPLPEASLPEAPLQEASLPDPLQEAQANEAPARSSTAPKAGLADEAAESSSAQPGEPRAASNLNLTPSRTLREL